MLTDADIARIRAKYPEPKRIVKVNPKHSAQRGRPKGDTQLQANRCWHWCPTGKHDWAHELVEKAQGNNLDEWRQVCQMHRKELKDE